MDVSYASTLIAQVYFCDTYKLSYKIPLLSEYTYARIWLVYPQERSISMVRPTMKCTIISQERSLSMVRPTMKCTIISQERSLSMVRPTMDILICNISRAMSRLFFLSNRRLRPTVKE